MRLVSILLTAVSALGFFVLPSAASAAPVAADAPVTTSVVFAAGDNGVVTPDADLVITGTITNGTTSDIPAGTATVSLERSLVTSRTTLTDWLTDAPLDDDALGTVIFTAATPLVRAGFTGGVSIRVPAATLGLSARYGVHKLAVRVDANGASVGQSRSTIVVNPGTPIAPVPLAVAAPLTVPAAEPGLLSAATLTQYTGVGGVLTTQLNQAVDRRVALGVDPRIIASITILGPSAPPSATAWLDRLRAADNDTFALAYADTDLAVQSQARAPRVLGPTSFTIDPKLFPGYSPAPTETPTVSPTPTPSSTPIPTLPTSADLTAFDYTIPGIAWPADNTVAAADLDFFAASDLTTSILDSDNVSYGTDTSGSAATVGAHPVIVSDHELSTLLRAAVTATDASWPNAMANLSAALSLAGSARAAEGGPLLATLGRTTPGLAGKLGQTLDALATLPWFSATALHDIARSQERAAVAIVPKPETDARVDAVQTLLAAETSVGNFSSALDDPTVLSGPQRLSLLSTLSNEWLSLPDAWTAATKKYLKAAQKTAQSVRIADTGSQVFVSNNVNLNVAVTNELAYPVTVYVSVVSPNGAITVENPRVELRVEANSQSKALVPVTALANGDVTVRASLSSATNSPIGTVKFIDVDVQAGWETAATLVVVIGIVAVFGFGIYRNIAKRRKKKRNPDDPADVSEGDPASVPPPTDESITQ
ncbi:DUF6049 family protein [Lacisediminihabitans changchengi]|uniref:2-oxoglutarate dehydrogenase n=1 Tax=Lacisediminihabitans changchengi TaxID=2787634 RepID=A0A934W5P0_9MICO|nr:DUF6049 family protein [Lacisediminihabitans changchengi]MBK4348735.1 hypothetical protein [Lacisediminihabitans changchengi]